MMTLDNTTGYTQAELDDLNAAFDRRFAAGDWPTDDRAEAEKWFADEVATRFDAWWAWHDADASRWSESVAEAEQRCLDWVVGDGTDGPESR